MQAIIKIPEQLEISRSDLLKAIRDKLPAAREVRYLSNIEPAAAGEKSLAIIYDGKIETDVREILKQFIKKDETNMSKTPTATTNSVTNPTEHSPATAVEQPVTVATCDIKTLATPDIAAWYGVLPWLKNAVGVLENLWNRVAAVVKRLDDLKADIEKDSTDFETEQEEKRLNAAKDLDNRLNTITASIAALTSSINDLTTRLATQEENLSLLRPEIEAAKAYRDSVRAAMAVVQANAEKKADEAKKAEVAKIDAAKITKKV